METIKEFFENFISPLTMLKIEPMDIIEILIIAILIYNIIKWVKNTRAWTLLKGLIILFLFYAIASLLDLEVIMWIFVNTIGVGITALVIVFQPELRKALEQLGQKNIVSPLLDVKDKSERFSNTTIDELIKAVYELAKTRTGALIVIENEVLLDDYEKTGIKLDALITSQLLINIFEHNTPLHDGAVIVRGNRIVAATCYLPLSDNMQLSKELGTRHRAGVGITDVTDCFTIIVSEETGAVSVAGNGNLIRSIGRDKLYNRLKEIQKREDESVTKKRRFFRRAKTKNEALSDK